MHPSWDPSGISPRGSQSRSQIPLGISFPESGSVGFATGGGIVTPPALYSSKVPPIPRIFPAPHPGGAGSTQALQAPIQEFSALFLTAQGTKRDPKSPSSPLSQGETNPGIPSPLSQNSHFFAEWPLCCSNLPVSMSGSSLSRFFPLEIGSWVKGEPSCPESLNFLLY